MKLKVLPFILTLGMTAAHAQTTFTISQASYESCDYHLLVVNSQVVNRFTCTPINAVLQDGTPITQAFYVDEVENADGLGGVFTGQYYTNTTTIVTFTGSYVGTVKRPTAITGTWATGNVTMTLSTHPVGRNRSPYSYIVGGSGSE